MTKLSGQRIFLIRHGETEWNRLRRFQGHSDLPLNSKGQSQAQALAQTLKNNSINAIYSSPLKRAVETAIHIGTFHPSTPLIKESGLKEMNLGEFEGVDAQQWAAQHQEFRKAWEENPADLAIPGGESLRKVQMRAIDAFERISESHEPDSTLLICSHTFVIVSLLCFVSKIPLNQFRESRQNTAALNIFYKNGMDYQVKRINDCRHLL
jgi:broad specificity phosphatase PhoE